MSTARLYELVYITPPETTEDALAELHTQVADIVQRFGGTIDRMLCTFPFASDVERKSYLEELRAV